MLAIAISLLFGLAAFAALVVIHASLVEGARGARRILAELSPGECGYQAGLAAEVRCRLIRA